MSGRYLVRDAVSPGQLVWFVGTAPSRASAAAGAYYAHPGNRFWRALHESGITARRMRPDEFELLSEVGIGFTDFCKTEAGVDSEIPRASFDAEALRGKVQRLAPRTLAFTGKTAASLWFGRSTTRIAYGRQVEASDPVVFVLTSPSGLASGAWSLEPWKELAAHLRG
jgi:double-stranded uracil-DNA glycosylase